VHRYFITGTDTDVGKTRTAAALALALRDAGRAPTVVKLVQTGVARGVPGDAARAGGLAGVRYVELARFEKPADPWTAALAEGKTEVRAYELVDALATIPGAVVAEGAGGIMVPLNPNEHFGDVAAPAALRALIVVGLRLGCLNHALLTANLCDQTGIPIVGAVLVERWAPVEATYREEVARALQGKLRILGILPFAVDEALAVVAGAKIFEPIVGEE
jgi:dethiobiotin synthetase